MRCSVFSTLISMPRLTRTLTRWSAKLHLERDWSLLMIAAIIGLVMGSVAMAFIIPLRWIEEWVRHADRTLLFWLVPTAPIVGALLTGIVLMAFGEKGLAPGVSAVMYSIHRKKSRLELKIALGKWIASTFTIGSGGSAGAEGPIVTIGSVIGSNIGRLFRANTQNRATLLGCGAAAGIASVFNAPFAGIFFAMEILLRDFSLRTFTPIVIAAVISAAFTQGILGTDALFATHEALRVGPFRLEEVPNFLVLGVVCGAVAATFTRGLSLSENLFGRLKLPTMIKPAIGAAILGLFGILYLVFIHSPHGVPEFYGNGYPVITELLSPAYYLANMQSAGVWNLLGLVALIGLLKLVATCLTIGSGGSGGLFAPSLLLGACVGGAFGLVMTQLGWFPEATPAHYALVGMAAMIAATAHAPLTAILLVYEITQNYSIILPLMFAAVISTIVGRLIYPESVYTVKLAQLGVRIGALSDLTILRRLSVHEVPLVPAVLVHTNDSAHRLLELSEKHLARDFVVVDDREGYLGMITGSDLAAALVYREAIPLLQVSEMQRADLPTVTMDETLDIVLDKFAKHDAYSLAVLDGDGRKVRGLITRANLMERYQSALTRD
jgi:CIC family chloride channel protein